MEINRLGLNSIGNLEGKSLHMNPNTQGKQSFEQVFNQYFNGVNTQMLESEKLTARLATGEVNNLHEVTIAAQKATIALQLTVQVRDKALEAYQEMMRMQV